MSNETDNLLCRGLLLEYITLGWNVVGVAVVLYAAIKARSVTLAGFGLDSLIEIGASTVVIWELTGTGEARQKKALRLIGAAFFALALYILAQSARTLALHRWPETSPLGIVWLVVTFAAKAVTPGRQGLNEGFLRRWVLLGTERVAYAIIVE